MRLRKEKLYDKTKELTTLKRDKMYKVEPKHKEFNAKQTNSKRTSKQSTFKESLWKACSN